MSPPVRRQLRMSKDLRALMNLFHFWKKFGSERIIEDLPQIELRMDRFDRLVPPQEMGARRYDLINAAINSRGYSRYLEIGVRNPADCFDRVKVERKWSVDPGLEFARNPVDFQLTSDEFFSRLDRGELADCPMAWDVVFIDGLHRAEQVWRDIENASRHLRPGGMIFLHDCLPPNETFARERFEWALESGLCWNGTCWKALARYVEIGSWLTYVVATDWGVGVIDSAFPPRRERLQPLNTFYEYEAYVEQLSKERRIIPAERFMEALRGC